MAKTKPRSNPNSKPVDFKQVINTVLLGVFSKDGPTRKMAMVFLLSCGLVVAVAVLGVKRWSHLRAAAKQVQLQKEKDAKRMGDYLGKLAEESKRKYISVSLGTFNLELKDTPNLRGKPGLNVAQVEIVAECDSKETSDYIDEHMAQVSNQLTNVLTALDREELLSPEGKRRIKQSLIQKINAWLPSGKVERIFFPKLLIS